MRYSHYFKGFIVLALIVVTFCLEDATLQYSRMIPGFTKFEYNSNEITFVGFTIDGNIVCLDKVNYLIFEKPNLRFDKPSGRIFQEWSRLNLLENTLGILYDPLRNGNDQFSLGSIQNKIIYGSDARIENCNLGQQNPACKGENFNEVLQYLILRGGSISDVSNEIQNSGVDMEEVLSLLSIQNNDYVPVAVVGGGVRDFETGKINDINDIDVSIGQDYTQIGYRLKDIFVEWNQAIDSSVLDQQGIRKTFGLLKIRPQINPGKDSFDCDARNYFTDFPCYGDGLDIGPFKAQRSNNTYKYTNGRILSDEEISNHYFYAYSYDLDKNSRDFTVNCIYYDFLGRHLIDPTGLGISDATSEPPILRIADDLTKCGTTTGCNWDKDLGGWFRFWRFISPAGVADGKGFQLQPEGVAEKHVCGNLIKTMCQLIENGYDKRTEYSIYGFFEKFRKKRNFLGNVDVILNSMRDLMISEEYNDKTDNCMNAWYLLTKVASSDQLNTWVHLLEGSATTSLTLEIIQNLADRYDPSLGDNDICQNLDALKQTLRPLQSISIENKSSLKVSSERTQNFLCFMKEYILSGKSFGESLLVAREDVYYNYEDQANPLDLDDYTFYNEIPFEEGSLPLTSSHYPRWTDLEISFVNDYDNKIYVHKLLLMFVYPRVNSLSQDSDLSIFVQSLLDGNEDSLTSSTLILSEHYSTIVKEIGKLYKQENLESFLSDLSMWRERLLQGDEITQVQWENIADSVIVTSENSRISVSRFFLSCFCNQDGIEELSLLFNTKYLLWEIWHNQEWVLPSLQSVNSFINVLTETEENTDDMNAGNLLSQALSGDSFCLYDYYSYSNSPSSEDDTDVELSIETSSSSTSLHSLLSISFYFLSLLSLII